MKKGCRLMDRIFDPLPKKMRNDPNNPGEMFCYQAQDEGYKRYKHLCYRNLILEALLAFILGLLTAYFFKF